MKTGIELIAAERQRQVEVEGWTPDHDAKHADSQMADAAMCYIGTSINEFNEYSSELSKAPYAWPWAEKWWKPSNDPVRNLVKAGALIAAEIDRIQRRDRPAPDVCENCGHGRDRHVDVVHDKFRVARDCHDCDCPGYRPPTTEPKIKRERDGWTLAEPAESEDVTIKTILGHSGQIVVVVKRGSATDSISLEGLIQGAVMGRKSTVDAYRTALKNLGLKLLEWSIEND
jgi:hypothetical protein